MCQEKSYRPWSPRQGQVFPPSPLDWLPEDHLAYFVLDLVEELDLRAIEDAIQEKDPRGNRPFDPRMMTALLVYGYCTGVASSRKLERATYLDVGFRVLAAGNHPDHSAINEFRRAHLQALKGIFGQVLALCRQAGLVKLGHVAFDGSKMKANASKHKAMSHERMVKVEQEIAEEVERLLEEAERVDQEEDARYGKGNRKDELPEELRRRESRLKKIREAKAALEAEAAATRAKELAEQAERARQKAAEAQAEGKEKAEQAAAKAQEKATAAKERACEKAEKRLAQAEQRAEATAGMAQTPSERRQAKAAQQAVQTARQDLEKVRGLKEPSETCEHPGWPEHRVPADQEGSPKPTAQRNFTDPDSRIMKTGSDSLQGYNCQIGVDEAHQIIVAAEVTNQAPDAEHLPPMLKAVQENCGAVPKVTTADAGYWSEKNAKYCEKLGTDPHIAVQRQKHGAPQTDAPAPPKEESEDRQPMRRKLQAPQGRAVYARRKAVVEPVFGQIKEARGFRRFLLRGIEKVRGEWSLICAAHNLLKLFRASARQIAPPKPAHATAP